MSLMEVEEGPADVVRIVELIDKPEPGRGGEIQRTDALLGVVFRGRRYDTGDHLDYLKTVIRLACERPDLGPEPQQWIGTNFNELAPLEGGQ